MMVICRGRPMASAMPTASFSPSVFVRRKFLQQVRPVASHDTAYFVIDDIDVVERLNLHADPFKVLWAERAAVQEFHWHTFAPPRGRRHRVQPGDTGIGALPGHQEHRKPSKRLPTEASGWRPRCGYRSPGLYHSLYNKPPSTSFRPQPPTRSLATTA